MSSSMFTLTRGELVAAAGLGGATAAGVTGNGGRPASFTLNGAPCAVA